MSYDHDPVVSVLMPTYNRAAIISRAIGSVLKQSYTRIEVVVVNDGSTDNTMQVLKDTRELDSRIVCCENSKEKGSAGARRTGLERMGGEYIAFLDDDDEYYPDKIGRELDIFTANPEVDVVVSGVCPELWPEGKQGSDWVALEFRPHQVFHPCAVTCRRKVLENTCVRWGNMEWRDLAFQVYEAGFTVWFSGEKLFRIHRTPGSLGTNTLARYKIALENAERYYQLSRGRKEHAVFERYLAICHKNIGNFCLKNGSPWEAVRGLIGAYSIGKRLTDLVPFT